MWVRCQFLLLVGLQVGAGAQPPLAMQSLTAGDTFAAAQISKTAQGQIADLLEKNTVDWDRSRISKLRVRRIALTPDKKDGLAVLSTASVDCGATGNCLFMILQQKKSGWRLVLHDIAIERFAITRHTHNGFYDLELSANDSAETGALYQMAFHGTEYHFNHCFSVKASGAVKSRSTIPCPEEGTE